MRTKPSRSGPKKGFTIAETLLCCALFGILSLVLVATLTQVTSLWSRTNSHDDAIAQILKAKAFLVRDLANASSQPGQFANTTVTPSLSGSGWDGAALTFLTPYAAASSEDSDWSANATSGRASMESEITYYLYVPNAPNRYGIVTPADGHPADGQGYEQQCAFKWLFRRVDHPAAAPTAVLPWLNLVPGPQPTSLMSLNNPTSKIQVIASQLLGFKVLKAAPLWTIELSSVAVADATHKSKLGFIPLAKSSYTVVEQFTVMTNNN
jgi:hypothetical protein